MRRNNGFFLRRSHRKEFLWIKRMRGRILILSSGLCKLIMSWEKSGVLGSARLNLPWGDSVLSWALSTFHIWAPLKPILRKLVSFGVLRNLGFRYCYNSRVLELIVFHLLITLTNITSIVHGHHHILWSGFGFIVRLLLILWLQKWNILRGLQQKNYCVCDAYVNIIELIIPIHELGGVHSKPDWVM
jgi:hypothetical protein